MAKTLIWAVALIVSALILATGGLNAQRVMIPPEEPAPPPADSDSVPVAVTNFPTVDIRSFPHVVTVEGTVDVGNFPVTQNVAGTVDVGNLPLDADGNLKVSPSADSSPAYRFFRLPDLYAPSNGSYVWGELFDVSGWERMALMFTLKEDATGNFQTSRQVGFIDPDAGPVFFEDGNEAGLNEVGGTLIRSTVHGPEVRVGIRNSGGGAGTVQIWVYLSN